MAITTAKNRLVSTLFTELIIWSAELYAIVNSISYKLSAYGLNAGSISQIIGGENANHPGGYVTQGDQKVLVRTMGQYYPISVS